MTDNITPELEAMCRVFYDTLFEGEDIAGHKLTWAGMRQFDRERHYDAMRAALLAIREPSVDLSDAGLWRMCDALAGGQSDPKPVWIAMIDHILGEPNP
jgi:hypothetical protein